MASRKISNLVFAAIAAFCMTATGANAVISTKDRDRERFDAQEEVVRNMNAAIEAMNAKNYPEAALLYTKVIENPKTSAEIKAKAHSNRGFAFTQLQQCQQAVADFDVAEATVKDNATIYVSRGLCYINSLNQPVKGIADLDTGIALDPNNVDYIRARCVAKFNLKDMAGALPDCERVVQAKPDDKVIHLAIGQGSEILKNNPRAIAAYKRVLELDPALQSAKDGLKRLGG